MHLNSELGKASLQARLEEFAFAPLKQPELLPTVLPLILGAIVIELYFGKHSQEELGWNTAVGNAIIWTTTGVTLLITTELSELERYVSYSLIGIGGLVAYMDFYHKWSSSIAFIVSSSGIVYSLAYIAVIVIKTGMPLDRTTAKAAIAFFIGVNILFKLVKGLETPARDDFDLN
ncbi:MAG: hypothetical protein ABEJ56_07000 [Candidatus Nanohaloarchaea archaeon]